MKTVIRKRYRDGFFLAEQDLRRIHQIMVEAARKVAGENHVPYFYVRLQNGTILELASVEEVLGLENSGQKEIEYLYLAIAPAPARHVETEEGSASASTDEWQIYAKFERVEEFYPSSWTVFFEVRGDSRDWVVLTASELEDRASAVRKFSASKTLQTPWAPVVLLMICVLAGVAALLLFAPKPTPVTAAVEQLYSAGKLTNPIEAMILLEKERSSRIRSDLVIGYFLIFVTLAAATSLGLPRLARLLAAPHVFYWGDYVAIYKRRRGFSFVVWTVVVLGVAVGILSTYLAKLLGV